jgi:DNA-binding phage protein
MSALADAAARSSRPNSEAVIELLRADHAFADEYLHAAMEQADQEGGRDALLMAQRLVAEARNEGR